jgi:predicted kinase
VSGGQRPSSAGPSGADLYLLCGLAFAGKSTLARAIAAHAGAMVVSLDAINARRGLAGGLGIPPEEWRRSHAMALAETETALASGRPVVVDDTHCFRFLRDDFRSLAGRLGATCVVVLVDAPLALVQRRRRDNDRTRARPPVTEEVLLELARCFETPGPDETVMRVPPDGDMDAWVAANLPAAEPRDLGATLDDPK